MMNANIVHQEEVFIPNDRGELLHGYIETTDRIHKNTGKQLVILCHGLLANKDYLFYPLLAQILSQQANAPIALDIFRFDFAGEGPLSQGSFEYGNDYKQVRDLHSVVEYWRKNGQYQIYAMIGHSKGANIVLMYNAMHTEQSIPLVIALSGRFDMSKYPTSRFTNRERNLLETEGKFLWRKQNWIMQSQGISYTRSCWVTKQSLDLRSTIDMKALLEKQDTGKTRYVIIHGTGDSMIPVEDAHSIHSILCKHNQTDLILIEGADHFFSKHMSDLIHFIVVSLYQTHKSKL